MNKEIIIIIKNLEFVDLFECEKTSYLAFFACYFLVQKEILLGMKYAFALFVLTNSLRISLELLSAI